MPFTQYDASETLGDGPLLEYLKPYEINGCWGIAESTLFCPSDYFESVRL